MSKINIKLYDIYNSEPTSSIRWIGPIGLKFILKKHVRFKLSLAPKVAQLRNNSKYH